VFATVFPFVSLAAIVTGREMFVYIFAMAKPVEKVAGDRNRDEASVETDETPACGVPFDVRLN